MLPPMPASTVSPVPTVKLRRHLFQFCVVGFSAALLGLFGSSGCGLLGTSCSDGRYAGGTSSSGTCSDGTHYFECVGGEGYEHDLETACPSSQPLCVASSTPGDHRCVTQDEQQCLSLVPGISGVDFQRADLNGDGLLDLAYLSGSTFTVALASKTGALLPPTRVVTAVTQFRLAHLSESQAYDIAMVNQGGQLFFSPGAADGTFPLGQVQLLSSNVLTLLGVGDADGDGLDDIFVEMADQSVAVLNSAHSFQPTTVLLTDARKLKQAALADTDGDGASELLLSDAEFHTDVYQRARGIWIHGEQLPGRLLAAPDLNGDGRADLLLNGPVSLIVELASGDGTFVQGQEFPGQGAVVADFDGDGALDVELIRDASLVELQGHSDGSFEERTPLDISTGGNELVVLSTPGGSELLLAGSYESSRLRGACLAR